MRPMIPMLVPEVIRINTRDQQRWDNGTVLSLAPSFIPSPPLSSSRFSLLDRKLAPEIYPSRISCKLLLNGEEDREGIPDVAAAWSLTAFRSRLKALSSAPVKDDSVLAARRWVVRRRAGARRKR